MKNDYLMLLKLKVSIVNIVNIVNVVNAVNVLLIKFPLYLKYCLIRY